MCAADPYRPPDDLRARVELLRKGGHEIESVVEGRSMEPAIPLGARIRIMPAQRAPAVGTTAAIVTPGGLVAHRVIGRGRLPWNRRFVLTQGDGTVFCDPPIPVGLVLGEVRAWRHDGDWREVEGRSSGARAVARWATLWRTLVRSALVVHPRLAAVLVRWSLRGRVAPVRWSA
jgi:hypothetical protein